MKRKHLFLIAALLLILTVSVFSAFWYVHLRSVNPEGKITAFFHIYSSPAKEQLEKVLREFSREYPEVELDYTIEPYLDMKRTKKELLSEHRLSEDHIVVSASTASDIPEDSELSPGMWTGTEWRLFYNSRVLDKLNVSEQDLLEKGRSGLMDFVEYFSPLVEPNQNIFAVSSKFYFQWLAWLQHIELEQNSGRMPDSFSLDKWMDSISLFNELAESTYINNNHRDINEAGTVLSMYKGDALFVLETDKIYSLFLPGDREHIKSVHFPGSKEQGWAVGSGFYLTITKTEETTRGVDEAARVFVDYLRSDEVIDHMLKSAGYKLYPPRTGRMLEEIPSITGKVRDKELTPLIEYISSMRSPAGDE